MESERIAVTGMSCQHCVARVRKALEDMDSVEVQSLEIGEARVLWDPERVDRGSIVAAIRLAGYSAM